MGAMVEMTAPEERWRTNSDAEPEGIGNWKFEKMKEKGTKFVRCNDLRKNLEGCGVLVKRNGSSED
jgi:hypothetical protein